MDTLKVMYFYYICVMSIIAFLMMFIDKRKAVSGKWRISELTLLSFGILGGAAGILSGMVIIKHKLSKARFRFLMPLGLILHAMIIGYFLGVFA